ncbi:FCD domain-containing protein [Paenibacillus sp. LMG 31460]|uniref:FCD domain-containing protein n=1 Tax=Paenibacillus germinis TaxID=2654979 RepID=A0ABX1Z836_9BACL|nr:GntR family transcriptional regulator [Paenibacillus germinis]NOU88401.1 FCD domain-containing protein [Paenibacillus germinis]
MYELEHTELSEKVYHLLKKMILNREFIGGQRLDLNDLSQKMNISRTPLKDAVNRLVLEGLMEVKPRSGTFVTSLKKSDIEEVSEIRLMIEQWCVSHLTEFKAQKLVNTLEEILEDFKGTLAVTPFPFESFLELDIRFHNEIVQAADNHRMLEQYRSINSFLYAARIYFFQSYERSISGHDEHNAFVQALKRNDIKDACAKLEEHIKNSKINMIDHLTENGGVL